MQPVLGADHEQIGASGQRQHEDSGARGVEQGIGSRNRLGQNPARLRGAQSRHGRRNQEAHRQRAVHRNGRGPRLTVGLRPGDGRPSEDGGSDIVGMTLEVGGEAEDLAVVQGLRLGEQTTGEYEARHNGRRR